VRIGSILSEAEAWLPPCNVPPAGHPRLALPWRLINRRHYTNVLDAICTSGTPPRCPMQSGMSKPIKAGIKRHCRWSLDIDFSCWIRKPPSMDDCSISVAAWEIFLRRRVILDSKLRALN